MPTWLRFALVGVAQMVLSYLCFAVLHSSFELDNSLPLLIASYVASAGAGYVLNSLWTFGARPTLRRFGCYLTAYVPMLLLNEIVMRVVDPSAWLPTQAVFLPIAAAINFLLQRSFTFRR